MFERFSIPRKNGKKHIQAIQFVDIYRNSKAEKGIITTSIIALIAFDKWIAKKKEKKFSDVKFILDQRIIRSRCRFSVLNPKENKKNKNKKQLYKSPVWQTLGTLRLMFAWVTYVCTVRSYSRIGSVIVQSDLNQALFPNTI